MIRKLGLGISVLALLTPGLASALGVGDYQLKSYLNQPLDMEISLTGAGDLSPSDIVVDLASQQEFTTAGIRRSGELSKLDFKVKLNDDGTGTIDVSTDKPIGAPYMDFLVKILWPTGRILREYTILLDPPSYSANTNSTVTAAASGSTGSNDVTSLNTPSQPATVSTGEQTPTKPAPTKTAQKSTYLAGNATSPQPQAAPSTSSSTRYTVQSGDTLWGIASQYRPGNSVSIQQVIVAIEKTNPDAFYVNGNANFVKAGAVLHIPAEATIRQYNTRHAMQNLAQQNAHWRKMLKARGIPVPGDEQQITAGSNQVQRHTNAGGAQSQGEVTLLASDKKSAQGGAKSAKGTVNRGDAANGAAGNDDLQNELAVKAETVDRLQQQNKELDSRIGDLKQQVATSDKLLDLRNSRIAALQERLRELKKQGADIDPALLKAVKTKAAAQQKNAAKEAAADNSDNKTASKPADEKASSTAKAEQLKGEKAPATVTAGQSAEKGADAKQAKTSEQQAAADKTEAGSTAKNASTANSKTTPVKTQKAVESPQQSQGLVGGIIDFITGNLLIVGIIILLLILIAVALVMRGNKQEEEEADFADDEEFGDDGFLSNDLAADDAEDDEEDQLAAAEGDEDDDGATKQDPLEEVEMYVAYGRFPQAIDFLRKEVESAPERSDLKVKLLEVEKEAADDDAFKQDAAKFAGSSDDVDACIERLGGAATDEPSLDDLASDLSDESFDTTPSESADDADNALTDDLDDFGDFDLGANDSDTSDDSLTLDDTPALDLDSDADDDFSLDFDAETGSETETEAEAETSADDDALSLDLEEADGDSSSSDNDDFSLDDAFNETSDDTLTDDDLSAMDSSDDAISLDDDFDLGDSNTADATSEAGDDDAALSLEDTDFDLSENLGEDLGDLGDVDAGEDETATLDLSEAALDDETTADENVALDSGSIAEEAEPATDDAASPAAAPSADLGLDDEDEFAFLGDTDENATKLDLARAYIDMGDSDGAQDILNEVAEEGSEQQQSEARELLSKLS